MFILAEGEPALSRSQTDQTGMSCEDLRTRVHCPCPGARVYFTACWEQDVQFITPLSPSQDRINHLRPRRASAQSGLCLCRSRTQRHGCWGVDAQPSLRSRLPPATRHRQSGALPPGAGRSGAQIRPPCLRFLLWKLKGLANLSLRVAMWGKGLMLLGVPFSQL